MISLEEFAKLKKKLKPKKSKYNASQIFVREIRFASKLEAKFYEHLLTQKELKHIDYFLMQVPFRLPGNIKYLVDFQVFTKGSVSYIDVKGVMTDVSRNKIKQVQDLYNIEIMILNKYDIKKLTQGF